MIPSSLRWMLLFTVLIVPQVLWGGASAPAATATTEWFATVGAQSNDKGHQALAFLPNEIWIHAGDSITWTFDVDEVHTVTFIPDEETPAVFPDDNWFDPTPPTFDPPQTTVSSPGGPDSAFVKGDRQKPSL